MKYADEYAKALRYEAAEPTPTDAVAAHPDTAAFHAKMREEGQFGVTPLVYADFLEEQGMPMAAGLIRQHAQTYRHGHTWLDGRTYTDHRPGHFIAERLNLPYDFGLSEAENDEVKRTHPHDTLVQLHQASADPDHAGRTFAWAAQLPRDDAHVLLQQLAAEGVHVSHW